MRLDQIGVAGALQFDVRPVARAQDVRVGMQFVRPGEFSRARHRHGVSPARAAFRGEQIIPAVALVEMRRFGEAERRAFENVRPFADELAFLHRVFLQDDSGEAIVSGPMVPKHVDEIFAAVVVVEERRIEAAAVEINGIGPIAVNARAGDEVIVKVAQRRAARAADGRAAVALHVRVNQPEQAVRVASGTAPRCRRNRDRPAC